MNDNYSLAAKLYLISGKLSGLTEGLAMYPSPTGENVNSKTLATYLIAATIEDLKNRGFIEYREDKVKALVGEFPTILIKRIKTGGVGFEKNILDKLYNEINLIDLVSEIIGGRYQMPEYQILYLIRKEFPKEEFLHQIDITTLFIFKRKETRFILEKVNPLVEKWLPELKPVWDQTLNLPWLKIAIRNCNFGFSSTRVIEKDDHEN